VTSGRRGLAASGCILASIPDSMALARSTVTRPSDGADRPVHLPAAGECTNGIPGAKNPDIRGFRLAASWHILDTSLAWSRSHDFGASV
jgi:hypothetical protein